MKKVTVIVLLIGLLAACSGDLVLTEEAFKKGKEFDGELVEIKKIDWPKNFVPWSGAGPHYSIKIRLSETQNVIVDRIMTDVTWWGPKSEISIVGIKGKFPSHFYKSAVEIMRKNSWPNKTPTASP